MKHRHLEIAQSSSIVRVGRREWLVGMLGSGVLVACSGSGASTSSTSSGGTSNASETGGGGTCAGSDVGATTDFAVGSWTKNDGFILAQDSDGFFAYTTVCTHSGCTIGAPDTTGKSTCPCHGSQFDGNGAVLKGPARLPLKHYAVTICDGEVFVDTKTIVDAGARTTVA